MKGGYVGRSLACKVDMMLTLLNILVIQRWS